MSDKMTNTFVKLGGENYPSWASRMRNYLAIKGVSRWIDDAITEGSPNEDKAASLKALGYIVLYVEDRWLTSIQGFRSAKEAWDLLYDQYMIVLRPMGAILQGRLFKSKMNTSQSIDEYFNELHEITTSLDLLQIQVPEATVINLILQSLPPVFDSAVESLGHSAHTYTLITLRVALLNSEALHISKGTSKSAHAHQAQSRNRGLSASTSNKGSSEKSCWHCGHKGHVKTNCKLYLETQLGLSSLVKSTTYAAGFGPSSSISSGSAEAM